MEPDRPSALPVPVETLEHAREYLRRSKADNTRRAYRADWVHFTAWSSARGGEALPAAPEAVALYMTELAATRKVSTLARRLAAISSAHQAAGLESPARSAVVRGVLAGIRRTWGSVATAKKPLLADRLKAILETLPPGAAGVRDRALLLVGFGGAFRRSELVSLDWADVEFRKEGLVLTLRRSKTDPEGRGRRVAIPAARRPEWCPVRALRAWREQAGGAAGPVFRALDAHGDPLPGRLSDRAVARTVKRAIAASGDDPAEYSGHSLRAGFATAAAMGGASERSIMNQTGHRSLTTVRRYIREGELFADNAAAKTGLF